MHRRARSWAAVLTVTAAAMCLSAASSSSAVTTPSTPSAITITTSASQPLVQLAEVSLALTAPPQWHIGQRDRLQVQVRNDSAVTYLNGSLRLVVPSALGTLTASTQDAPETDAGVRDVGGPDHSYPRSDGTTVQVWRNIGDLPARSSWYVTVTGTLAGEVALGSHAVSAEMYVNESADFVPSFYQKDASDGMGSYRAGDVVVGAQSATGYAQLVDLIQIAPATTADAAVAYGTVWVDATKDSQRSPTDPGLAGAQLRVCVGSSWCVTVSTDSNGRWWAPNPPDGSLSATVVAPSSVTGVAGSLVANGSVSQGRLAAAADLGIKFIDAKQLSGLIWRDYAGNATVDPMDTLAADVAVQASWLGTDGIAAAGRPGGDDIVFQTLTDRDGRFQLPAVPPGTYVLSLAQLPVGWMATAGNVGDGTQMLKLASDTVTRIPLVRTANYATGATRHLFGQQVIIAAEPSSSSVSRSTAADPLQPTAATRTATAKDPFGGTATPISSTSDSSSGDSVATSTSSQDPNEPDPLAYTGLVAIGALALALPLLSVGLGIVTWRRRQRRNSYACQVQTPAGWDLQPPQPRWLQQQDGDITTRVAVDWRSTQDIDASACDTQEAELNPTPVRAAAMARHREWTQKMIWAAVAASLVAAIIVSLDQVISRFRRDT